VVRFFGIPKILISYFTEPELRSFNIVLNKNGYKQSQSYGLYRLKPIGGLTLFVEQIVESIFKGRSSACAW